MGRDLFAVHDGGVCFAKQTGDLMPSAEEQAVCDAVYDRFGYNLGGPKVIAVYSATQVSGARTSAVLPRI